MKKTTTLMLSFIMLMASLAFSGCAPKGNTSGEYILDAKTALSMMDDENTVWVDMQKPEEYSKGHLLGAVNITMDEITIKVPVENTLAPKAKIEDVLSKNGISNDSTVIVYDNSQNMQAARMWWTLKVYGHENVKVVSGGLEVLASANAEMSAEKPSVKPAVYKASDKNTEMIATMKEVKENVNDPDKKTLLLDTRTQEEFDAGTIPGSKLIDFSLNNYPDGTYKTDQDIQILYYEEGIKPETPVIIYCKTSVRGAQTYLALANAGYTNLKLYDGAWLEWSSNPNNPVQLPEGAPVQSNQQDNS